MDRINEEKDIYNVTTLTKLLVLQTINHLQSTVAICGYRTDVKRFLILFEVLIVWKF